MRIGKSVAAALVMTLALGSGALAQTDTSANPTLEHFRAYRAALAHDDMATAEREASAALAASIARDGDGGVTAVLAINLAQARLALGRTGEAYEPAQRAFAITASGRSNIDPLLARLVLGRAELTDDHWRQGANRLEAALQETVTHPELNGDTYSAAADLGRWYYTQDQYEGAQSAWDIAKRMADAAGQGNDYARAEARMGHAAAVFVQAMAATISAQARPTDTHIGGNPDAAFDAADQELVEAQNILGPYAYTPSADGGLTQGQRVYASAEAWRRLLRAFANSRGLRGLAARHPSFDAPQSDGRPTCDVDVITEPKPNFPPGAEAGFTVGAVVLRLRVDEGGRLVDSQVAAAVPGRSFREAVERVTPQWRIERAASSAPNCRYSPIVFFSATFEFSR
jgi:tetratricopeptide (TPR) repeat protein